MTATDTFREAILADDPPLMTGALIAAMPDDPDAPRAEDLGDVLGFWLPSGSAIHLGDKAIFEEPH